MRINFPAWMSGGGDVRIDRARLVLAGEADPGPGAFSGSVFGSPFVQTAAERR